MTASRALRVARHVALLIVFISGGERLAQAKDPTNDAIGVTTNHAFETALGGENIDLMSGNLSLTIPIGPKYMLSDRYGYQVELRYNSKIWEHYCPGMVPATASYCPGLLISQGTYGLGFDISFGRVYQTTYETTDTRREAETVWRYQSPDGADHVFCWSEPGKPCWINKAITSGPAPSYAYALCGASTPTPCEGITLDGTGVALSKSAGVKTALLGDGTRVTFGEERIVSWSYRDYLGTQHPNYRTEHSWYATRIESVEKNGAVPVWAIDIEYAGGVNARISNSSSVISCGDPQRSSPIAR